jgi:hypothetical protein
MPNFNYHGGRILSNVDLTVVYARTKSIKSDGTLTSPNWIDSTNTALTVPISFVCEINSFLHDLVDSAFMDVLSAEYSLANGPKIGHGSFNSSHIIELPISQVENTELTILHTDIEKMLDHSVQSGIIPAPGKNTCYMVLITGTFVTVPNSQDIVGKESGGFHNPFILSDGTQSAYCLVTADQFNLVPFRMSHELAECITDPYLDGWYDENGSEICDMCPNPGTYSFDQLQLYGSTYHNNLISKIWSGSSGMCIAPADDNNIKKGPYLKISDTRKFSSDCAFGFFEGTDVGFNVSAYLDDTAMNLFGVNWTVQNAKIVKLFHNKLTVNVPPAGETFTISVTAFNEWGCMLTRQVSLISVSADQIKLQEIICKLRHELLTYWRFIDPLWDPLRDFSIRPVSFHEINSFNKLSKELGILQKQYRNLKNSGFNDKIRQ